MLPQGSKETEVTTDKSKQVAELKEQFQHLEIDKHLKDRLIWQHIVNRELKRDIDSKQNEVDTDWGN
ncbi:hypothetical protein MCEREM21_01150 [Burkholderiaceae bacterium]